MSDVRRVSDNRITFIVAERDIDSPFRATGAIIFEQFTKDTAASVIDRARHLGTRYGQLWIGQIAEEDLVKIEDCEHLLDEEEAL